MPTELQEVDCSWKDNCLSVHWHIVLVVSTETTDLRLDGSYWQCAGPNSTFCGWMWWWQFSVWMEIIPVAMMSWPWVLWMAPTRRSIAWLSTSAPDPRNSFCSVKLWWVEGWSQRPPIRIPIVYWNSRWFWNKDTRPMMWTDGHSQFSP